MLSSARAGGCHKDNASRTTMKNFIGARTSHHEAHEEHEGFLFYMGDSRIGHTLVMFASSVENLSVAEFLFVFLERAEPWSILAIDKLFDALLFPRAAL